MNKVFRNCSSVLVKKIGTKRNSLPSTVKNYEKWNNVVETMGGLHQEILYVLVKFCFNGYVRAGCMWY